MSLSSWWFACSKHRWQQCQCEEAFTPATCLRQIPVFAAMRGKGCFSTFFCLTATYLACPAAIVRPEKVEVHDMPKLREQSPQALAVCHGRYSSKEHRSRHWRGRPLCLLLLGRHLLCPLHLLLLLFSRCNERPCQGYLDRRRLQGAILLLR